LVPIYQATWYQIPGTWCHENLKYQNAYGFEAAYITYTSVNELYRVTVD